MKPLRRKGTKKLDPVLPDQGGRSMPVDPPHVHLTREEAIRQRAFEIYVKRGKQQGDDLEHWLAAESELTGAH